MLEVGADNTRCGVVFAQDPHTVGEGLFVQGDGAAEVPRRFVGAREVVAGGARGGVVFAEYLRGVGEGLFV